MECTESMSRDYKYLEKHCQLIHLYFLYGFHNYLQKYYLMDAKRSKYQKSAFEDLLALNLFLEE